MAREAASLPGGTGEFVPVTVKQTEWPQRVTGRYGEEVSMALARCDRCGQPQGRGGNVYVQSHPPVGHPDSGVVCGREGCENPAMLWLLEDEQRAYTGGQRVFELTQRTNAVKIRVQ